MRKIKQNIAQNASPFIDKRFTREFRILLKTLCSLPHRTCPQKMLTNSNDSHVCKRPNSSDVNDSVYGQHVIESRFPNEMNGQFGFDGTRIRRFTELNARTEFYADAYSSSRHF